MPISESERKWRASPAGKAARAAQQQRRRAVQRPCPDCGAPLEKHKHYCDACRGRRKGSRGPVGRPRKYPEGAERLVATYGLSLTEFDRMLADQGGLCAICGKELPTGDVPRHHRPQVDHDHRCCPGMRVTCGGKCVRGIVHGRCNRGVAHLGDDPALYLRAALYVERHNARLGLSPRELPLDLPVRKRRPVAPTLFGEDVA